MKIKVSRVGSKDGVFHYYLSTGASRAISYQELDRVMANKDDFEKYIARTLARSLVQELTNALGRDDIEVVHEYTAEVT